jgi:hypothetical protein
MNAEEARQKTLDTINGFENEVIEWDNIQKAIEEATKEFNYFQASWRTSRRMNLGNWIRLNELGYFVHVSKNSTNHFLEYIISFDRTYPVRTKEQSISIYYSYKEHEINVNK